MIKLLFLLTAFACNAQKDRLNAIDRNDVVVSSYNLGDSISKDEIDSLKINFDPIIDQDTLFYYYFGNSYFEVLNDKIIGFKLLDNNLKIEFSKLKIGDSTEALKKEYPQSFSSKYKPSEDPSEIVRISVANGGQLTDSFIHFEFVNGIITSIYYWEDY